VNLELKCKDLDYMNFIIKHTDVTHLLILCRLRSHLGYVSAVWF